METERSILRAFHADDLPRLCVLFANPGFMRFPGSTGYSEEQTAAVLEKFLKWEHAGMPSQFAVIWRETGELIGYCGFLHQEVDQRREMEIAYRLHPDFWNRGIATEAARAVRDHAFRDLQLERVISLIHPDNVASRRVAEKNGMRVEKETVFRGFPAQVFVMTREEWMAGPPP
jgi:ribosomal-protein-alanine N-acetyltransferase